MNFTINKHNFIIYYSLSAIFVLSIISAVICLPLISFAAIGLSKESWYLHKNVCEDMPSTTRYYSYKRTISRCSYYYESNCCISEKTLDDLKSATACYGFQIFVALVQAGVAIAASAMSCRVVASRIFLEDLFIHQLIINPSSSWWYRQVSSQILHNMIM